MSDENELKNMQSEANDGEANQNELSDNQLDDVSGGLGAGKVSYSDISFLVNNEKTGNKQ